MNTFAGQPLYNPYLVTEFRKENLRVPLEELTHANSLLVPVGPSPARGWFLLRRRDYNTLDPYSAYTATFHDDDSNTDTNFNGLYIINARCVTRGLKGDPDALYLVEVADATWLVKNPFFALPTTSQYNIRSPGYPETFYSDTMNGLVPWSWNTMIADLWSQLSSWIGPYPGLPANYTPLGTPEGWSFPGICCWDAINKILDLLGLAIARDLTNPVQFKIVHCGDADAKATKAIQNAINYLEDDLEFLDVGQARVPGFMNIYFHKRNTFYGTEETVRRDSLQWQTDTPSYSVQLQTTYTSAIGQGMVWDDFTVRFDENGLPNPIDTAQAALIAAQRSADYMSKLTRGGNGYMWQRYIGVRPFSTGSLIDGVAWKFGTYHEAGLERRGWVTEIIRDPINPFPTITDQGTFETIDDDSSNAKPPDFRQAWPNYPVHMQTVRLPPGAKPIATSYSQTADVYLGFVQQIQSGSGLRDREECWLLDPNKLGLNPGYYECRLSTSYLGLPLYVGTCCPSSAVSQSSSSSSNNCVFCPACGIFPWAQQISRTWTVQGGPNNLPPTVVIWTQSPSPNYDCYFVSADGSVELAHRVFDNTWLVFDPLNGFTYAQMEWECCGLNFLPDITSPTPLFVNAVENCCFDPRSKSSSSSPSLSSGLCINIPGIGLVSSSWTLTPASGSFLDGSCGCSKYNNTILNFAGNGIWKSADGVVSMTVTINVNGTYYPRISFNGGSCDFSNLVYNPDQFLTNPVWSWCNGGLGYFQHLPGTGMNCDGFPVTINLTPNNACCSSSSVSPSQSSISLSSVSIPSISASSISPSVSSLSPSLSQSSIPSLISSVKSSIPSILSSRPSQSIPSTCPLQLALVPLNLFSCDGANLFIYNPSNPVPQFSSDCVICTACPGKTVARQWLIKVNQNFLDGFCDCHQYDSVIVTYVSDCLWESADKKVKLFEDGGNWFVSFGSPTDPCFNLEYINATWDCCNTNLLQFYTGDAKGCGEPVPSSITASPLSPCCPPVLPGLSSSSQSLNMCLCGCPAGIYLQWQAIVSGFDCIPDFTFDLVWLYGCTWVSQTVNGSFLVLQSVNNQWVLYLYSSNPCCVIGNVQLLPVPGTFHACVSSSSLISSVSSRPSIPSGSISPSSQSSCVPPPCIQVVLNGDFGGLVVSLTGSQPTWVGASIFNGSTVSVTLTQNGPSYCLTVTYCGCSNTVCTTNIICNPFSIVIPISCCVSSSSISLSPSSAISSSTSIFSSSVSPSQSQPSIPSVSISHSSPSFCLPPPLIQLTLGLDFGGLVIALTGGPSTWQGSAQFNGNPVTVTVTQQQGLWCVTLTYCGCTTTQCTTNVICNPFSIVMNASCCIPSISSSTQSSSSVSSPSSSTPSSSNSPSSSLSSPSKSLSPSSSPSSSISPSMSTISSSSVSSPSSSTPSSSNSPSSSLSSPSKSLSPSSSPTSSSSSSGITTACCLVPLPTTIHATISNISGCGCMNGIVIPLTYNGILTRWENQLFSLCNSTSVMNVKCGGTDCSKFELSWSCAGANIAINQFPDAGCTCSANQPFDLVFTCTIAGNGCCGFGGGTAKVTVTT